MIGRLRAPKATLSDEEAERQRRSEVELLAGRLPVAAQERLARHHDEPPPFTSDLRTEDLVAVRAAGYEPVGQVFGAAVLSSAGRYYRHPVTQWRTPVPSLVQSWSHPRTVPGWFDIDREARRLATKRLLAEVALMGADGAIALRDLPSSVPAATMHDCSLLATAVRRRDRRGDAPPHPFLTELSGAEFGALRRGGYAPVATVFDVQRHMSCGAGGRGFGNSRLFANSWTNQEIDGLTELATSSREQARAALERQQGAFPGSSLLLHRFDVRPRENECPLAEGAHDMLMDTFVLGTVILPAAPVPTGGLTFRPVVTL